MQDAHAEIGGGDRTITFVDPRVSQLQIDHRFTLLLEDSSTIVFEAGFRLTEPTGASRDIASGDHLDVGPALGLFGRTVAACVLIETGELSIELDDGSTLRAPAGDAYESWQVVLQTGEQWIGLPGGGLAHIPMA